MYVQNNYFGVGSIPKQKPNLADTFRQYQNHIAKEESSLSSIKVGKTDTEIRPWFRFPIQKPGFGHTLARTSPRGLSIVAVRNFQPALEPIIEDT